MNLQPSSKNRKNCLAFQVAQTFPARIKQEVTRMVEYYEDTLEHQAREYHRMVQENHRLKKENNKLKAVNLSNDLRNTIRPESKENASPFRKEKVTKNVQMEASPAKNRLTSRVSEL